jgi:hypothetical protein
LTISGDTANGKLANSIDDRNEELAKKMSHVILRMCGKGRGAVNRFQEWGIQAGVQALRFFRIVEIFVCSVSTVPLLMFRIVIYVY